MSDRAGVKGCNNERRAFDSDALRRRYGPGGWHDGLVPEAPRPSASATWSSNGGREPQSAVALRIRRPGEIVAFLRSRGASK